VRSATRARRLFVPRAKTDDALVSTAGATTTVRIEKGSAASVFHHFVLRDSTPVNGECHPEQPTRNVSSAPSQYKNSGEPTVSNVDDDGQDINQANKQVNNTQNAI
jgi:hypothetical protein